MIQNQKVVKTKKSSNFHTGNIFLKQHQIASTLHMMLKALKQMEDIYGFKLIDYKPNGCVGKWQDEIENKY